MIIEFNAAEVFEGYQIQLELLPKLTSQVALGEIPLTKIREVYIEAMKTYPRFPKGRCIDVSGDLERLGLVAISGFFIVDRPLPDIPYLCMPHTWAEDRNRWKIDLTARQFNEQLDCPIEDSIYICRPGNPDYLRFVSNRINPEEFRVT